MLHVSERNVSDLQACHSVKRKLYIKGTILNSIEFDSTEWEKEKWKQRDTITIKRDVLIPYLFNI